MTIAILPWPAEWYYAHGKPEQSALFKSQINDFQVQESLGFSPSGDGEHVFLDITKVNTNTTYVAHLLAKLANVERRQVAYSGLKDRHGITRQWFAVHLPGKASVEPDWALLNSPEIHVHQATRHTKKLRIGVHQSNSFQVILRGMTDRDLVEQRLQAIKHTGVPNYFGNQRFGRDGNNLLCAFDLVQGKRVKDRNVRSLAMSAARSYLFNELLSESVHSGQWLQASGHFRYGFCDGYSQFSAEDDDSLQDRIDAGNISPLGWLVGRDKHDQISRQTSCWLEAYVPWIEALASWGMQSDYRMLRLMPQKMHWQWSSDDVLELRFQLLRGCYATSVVREVALLHQCQTRTGESS